MTYLVSKIGEWSAPAFCFRNQCSIQKHWLSSFPVAIGDATDQAGIARTLISESSVLFIFVYTCSITLIRWETSSLRDWTLVFYFRYPMDGNHGAWYFIKWPAQAVFYLKRSYQLFLFFILSRIGSLPVSLCNCHTHRSDLANGKILEAYQWLLMRLSYLSGLYFWRHLSS